MTALTRTLWRGFETRLDRIAIALSALCLVHCLATTVLLVALASAGDALGSPVIHKAGLALAILFGIVAFSRGVLRHRRVLPVSVGASGLFLMAAALAMPHGAGETIGTIVGVVLLALGHYLNRHFGGRSRA